MLCTVEPTGMCSRGIALPIRTGASGPLSIGSPTFRPSGRDLVEAGDGHEASAWTGGLELSDRHPYTLPNRPSIFWPSPSLTMAFFQSVVRPTFPEPVRRKLRRFLPRMVTVLISRTLMFWASYCSSRAFLISVLLAVDETLKVYRPCV